MLMLMLMLKNLFRRSAMWHARSRLEAKKSGGGFSEETDRRAFLQRAGKFAVVAPPTMTFLLSTTLVSEAVAASSSCNRGGGNGSENCDPGNSSGKPGKAGEGNGG